MQQEKYSIILITVFLALANYKIPRFKLKNCGNLLPYTIMLLGCHIMPNKYESWNTDPKRKLPKIFYMKKSLQVFRHRKCHGLKIYCSYSDHHTRFIQKQQCNIKIILNYKWKIVDHNGKKTNKNKKKSFHILLIKNQFRICLLLISLECCPSMFSYLKTYN